MNRIPRWAVLIPPALGILVFLGGPAAMSMNQEQPVSDRTRAALRDEGPMPDLDGAVAWLTSAPLTRDALRGKVVLVNF